MRYDHWFWRAVRVGAAVLPTYAIVLGLTRSLPDIGIGQTARNLFYHVPMWFSMYLMMGLSLYWSVRYLRSQDLEADNKAREAARVGVLFGFLGLFSGMIWARATWGELLESTDPSAYWNWDPKQTGALAAVFAYLAYFALRLSVDQAAPRARLAAVYNLFAAASMLPLTYIIPRMLPSLHPGGKDGEPLYDSSAISADYRLIFYPSIIGFMCMGLWLWQMLQRWQRLKARHEAGTTFAENLT